METYKIAGITVEYDSFMEPLKGRSKKYRVDNAVPEETFRIRRDEMIDLKRRSDSTVDWGTCEYLLMGTRFYDALIDRDGMLLHASAVVLDGEAYLFSAPCGTGKSTHTSLWLDYFGKDRAYILNDDKPAIRCDTGKPVVYGTPFSGKNDIGENRCAPLKGICFLEQTEDNTISRLGDVKALASILNQTIRPTQTERMNKLLRTVEIILENTPVYKMGCNISEDAVKLSYSTMKSAK